jgi:hypothetical protein
MRNQVPPTLTGVPNTDKSLRSDNVAVSRAFSHSSGGETRGATVTLAFTR